MNKVFIFINIRHTSQAKRALNIEQHIVKLRYSEKKVSGCFFLTDLYKIIQNF